MDVEPIYTFRGHRGPVLSCVLNQDGKQIFSGGLDGSIRIWNMPPLNTDPYDAFGLPSFLCFCFPNSIVNCELHRILN